MHLLIYPRTAMWLIEPFIYVGKTIQLCYMRALFMFNKAILIVKRDK